MTKSMILRFLQPKRAMRAVLFVLLSAAGLTKATAQVTLTQSTYSDFVKGTGLNVVINDDDISMQSKMTEMYDFEATTNLPQTLMNHQVVAWQDYVFCVGGFNGNNPVSTVYRAEQQENGISSWTTLNALPEALTDMAVIATQQYLVVMGGKNADGVSSKIYVATLDPINAELGEWAESSIVLPQPLWGARAIAVHDNIYLMGGATTDSETAASDKAYCLKLNSRGNVASITEVTALPEARNGHAVAAYDSKIYVTGGHDATGALKATVWAATVNLDGTLGTWTTQTALPIAVSNHTAVCTNGILAVIGGMCEELPSNQLYYSYMDGTALSWVTSSVVLSNRTHSGASCVFDNKICFTGGQTLSGSVVNFMRYAPVEFEDELVNKACFVSMPFDLGTPLKTIQNLTYNFTQGNGTSYEVLYRLADADLTYGNWISASTNNPISINQTKTAIQYMFRLTATGTENFELEDMNVTFSGYTQLAGNLDNMNVLTLANSPYMVTDDIIFTTGIHDIEAGVVIYFAENTELRIEDACVRFNGTADAPILLTYGNNNQSRWNGVYFTSDYWNNNAGVYNSSISSMTYTTIENAGYGENAAALRLEYAEYPIFDHCTFTGSFNHGIRMYDSNTAITNCSVSDNEGSALYLEYSSPTVTSTTMTGSDYGVYLYYDSYPTFTECSATGNNYGVFSWTPDRNFDFDESTLALFDNDIEIHTNGGYINYDCTWASYDNGYQVDGNININSSSNKPTLTIGAGNTIRMAAGKEIYINYGSIHAVGTETDSITFTSLNGQVGGWHGFRFNDNSDNGSASSLRYCVIEKADTNIECDYTTQPSLMYSTVREASSRNMDLYQSELNLDAVEISDAPYGIYLSSNSTVTMVMTGFDNLSTACIWNDGIDCTENFYNCTMSNSNIGVGYYNPNLDIPTFANRITFENVTSPVGLNGGTIRPSRTWLANDYSVFGDIYVRSNNSNDTVRLTIDPGSVLRFAEDKEMYIGDYYNEELYAEGREDAPIIFTSYNGEPGGWNGLRFYSHTRTTLLKHCVFENGNEYNVYVSNTNNPVFENCEFNNANSYGIRLYSATPEMTDCAFNGNGSYGVYFDDAYYVDDVMEGLQFADNLVDGIAVNGGTINTTRTWPAFDYIILNDVYVRNQNYNSGDTITLTLTPGCTLRFAQDREMYVGDYYECNDFYAEGTEEAPITFTSLNGEAGGWNGLHFYSHTNNAQLKHCVFENGNEYNVYVSNTDNPVFENCEFRNSNGYGIDLYQSAPELTDCDFNNNASYGVYFTDAYYVDDVMEGLQFDGNLVDGIAINGGTVSTNRTWPAYDYIILNNVYVRQNNYNSNDTISLTLNPGTTLRFAQGKYMSVGDYYNYNVLNAEGTEEAPITFTSLNGEVGGWNGLRFYEHTIASLLKHCIIENGNEYNVYVSNTNYPVFENCEIRNSNSYGMRITDYAGPTISLSSIHDNASHGFYLDNYSSANPVIGNSPETGNDIINNGGYAIYQDGYNDFDAAYNFFGTVDSLYIENNLIRDKIDYQYDGRVNVFPVSMLPVSATTITGSLLYDGNPEYTMEGSTVMVKTFDDELLYETTTDATGHFSFDTISYLGAKKFDFAPTVDVEATITTADALAVMLHYVHETMLTGSRLKAADVNGSLTVNGTDALLIQKRYVKQIETFPMGDVYYNLYDSVVYNNYSADLAITALCYGDVNASYEAPSRDGITLLTEGQMLAGSDQVMEIPVRVKTSLETGAISLKLTYPAEYLSVEGVNLPNGEEAMIYDNNGMVTISWYSLAPMYLTNDEILLTLVVRTKNLSGVEEGITFGIDNRSELADGSAFILSNVELSMPEMLTLNMTNLNELGSTTLSVYPNPMRDRSVVSYSLTAESRVSFVVYDLLGNQVYSIEEGRQSVGQHEIELTGLASGVYVGRLAVSGSHEEVQIVKIVVE